MKKYNKILEMSTKKKDVELTRTPAVFYFFKIITVNSNNHIAKYKCSFILFVRILFHNSRYEKKTPIS